MNLILQDLPSQGFEKQVFTKVYNDDSNADEAAVQLDSALYYTATTINESGEDVEYLFLYFVGIYYTTTPWVGEAE
jgi:hypothetical protein